MEIPAPPTMLQHLWKSALLSGILAVILGILVLAWPGITIIVAAIFFGAYLLVTGIAQVFFAFSLHVSAGGRVLLFISGAAALILAVLCFRSLQESILLLAIWIGVGFIFRGVATAVSAISDPTLPGRGWEIFIGVISLIAGVVMLASPFESHRDADPGRRDLAHRHRRLRGRLGVRHPQGQQERRRLEKRHRRRPRPPSRPNVSALAA